MGELKGPDYYDQMARMFMYKIDPEHTHYIQMWKWVLRYINQTDKIIELGCGTGQFAKMLVRKDVQDYNGYDFSPMNIEFARTEMCDEIHDKFHVENVHDVEIPPDAKVIMLELLEHIDDDVGLLKKLAKNEIIISLPNFDAPSHVRYFEKIDDIISRYGTNHIFHTIEMFSTHRFSIHRSQTESKENWTCALVGEPR